MVSQSVVLRLEVPPQVRLGEAVALKLKVKNASDSPVELALSGRPPHDFVVTSPDGAEVWRWSRGQAVQQILGLVALSPGQELELTAAWPQRDNDSREVPVGVYGVRGVLNLEFPKRLETEPMPLSISP